MKKIHYFLIFLLVLILAVSVVYAGSDSISFDVTVDGNQVSVTDSSIPFFGADTSALDNQIIDYAANQSVEINTNTDSFKHGVNEIAKSYGYSNADVNIDSPLGDGSLPLVSKVEGTSMEPTLHNGDTLMINRTRNIQAGEIVVCNDTEYGLIVKRVGQVNGNNVYLQSDNKSRELVFNNNGVYVEEGLHKWVTIDRIIGVVKYDLSQNSTDSYYILFRRPP